MATMKAKKWVLTKQFQGFPKEGDMQLQEEALPTLKTGDVLLEGVSWSVDPYMRLASGAVPLGNVMMGQHIGRITQSRNPSYPVGRYLLADVGWRSHTVINPDKVPMLEYFGLPVPVTLTPADTGKLSKSTTLGVLGMPGAAAYFGFLETCKPKDGETVLVSGAAGAVGSLVGQIAKIKGCKVIGFAGSDEKVKYLKDELGFDFALNYKKTDVLESLKKAAPGGIDCYFDNVGGELTISVLKNHMKLYGRVAVCGCISSYNDSPANPKLAPMIFEAVMGKQLKVEGFMVFRWINRYQEAWKQLMQWIKQGKLKYKEHVTEGFENMFSAFKGLLEGENTGKAVVVALNTDATKM